jgi:uncharacterized membrane protein
VSSGALDRVGPGVPVTSDRTMHVVPDREAGLSRSPENSDMPDHRWSPWEDNGSPPGVSTVGASATSGSGRLEPPQTDGPTSSASVLIGKDILSEMDRRRERAIDGTESEGSSSEDDGDTSPKPSSVAAPPPQSWLRGWHGVWGRVRSVRISWPFLLVLLGVAGFAGVMLWISWLKYYTFNATVLDLGLANQVYWLLSHGGVSGYQHSGLAPNYPIQYEESIYFLITPFYGLAPGIPFLLALQSVALGLSAIPLYLLARRRLAANWLPVVIVGIYLTFFTLSSAVLFDYHNESLFPLLFFSAVLAYETRHKEWFYLLGILAAIIDPLTLLVVAFFTLTTYVPRGGQSWDLKLTVAASAVRESPWDLVYIAALLSLLPVYFLSGTLFPSFAGNPASASGPFSIFFFAINDKLELLLFLFGALAFLPLLEWRTSFIMLPYLGFVFYTTSSSHWALFGLQYPLLGTCPLFYGLILSIANLVPTDLAGSAVGSSSGSTPPLPAVPNRARTWRHRDELLWRSRSVKALVLVSVIFALVYFPLSPVNQYVAGGYFEGNANLPGITTVTPAVQFLWQVIHLIPSNASVLTQNNIPQLSGRASFQTPATYNAGEQYDYLLIDTTLTYFSSPSAMIPFVDSALTNATFGIVAEGWGALLLERGYAGPIQLFEPATSQYLGNQLLPYAATVNGTTLVGNTAAAWMWYGPYIQLFPGTYDVNFTLSSNITSPRNISAITLAVDSQGGSVVYAQQPVYLGNFTAPNEQTQFDLRITVPQVVSDAEFRGEAPSGVATITLWSITITSTD